MPKFTKLNPNEVAIGRGRAALEARKAFVEALKAGDAGKIELERGDRPAVVKRRLTEASKELGIKIRSSWADKSERELVWKRTGRK